MEIECECKILHLLASIQIVNNGAGMPTYDYDGMLWGDAQMRDIIYKAELAVRPDGNAQANALVEAWTISYNRVHSAALNSYVNNTCAISNAYRVIIEDDVKIYDAIRRKTSIIPVDTFDYNVLVTFDNGLLHMRPCQLGYYLTNVLDIINTRDDDLLLVKFYDLVRRLESYSSLEYLKILLRPKFSFEELSGRFMSTNFIPELVKLVSNYVGLPERSEMMCRLLPLLQRKV
jgi:hypothetical protein